MIKRKYLEQPKTKLPSTTRKSKNLARESMIMKDWFHEADSNELSWSDIMDEGDNLTGCSSSSDTSRKKQVVGKRRSGGNSIYSSYGKLGYITSSDIMARIADHQ